MFKFMILMMIESWKKMIMSLMLIHMLKPTKHFLNALKVVDAPLLEVL